MRDCPFLRLVLVTLAVFVALASSSKARAASCETQ